MKWTDVGIITSSSAFGERSSIVTCLTETYGLHKGLFKKSSKSHSLQPGTIVALSWQGRLSEHLGTWKFEPLFYPFAMLIHQPLPLAALNSACSLIEVTLVERENMPEAHKLLHTLVRSVCEAVWEKSYITFERGLLSLMGFDLKLDQCASGQAFEELIYLSPKSGKAVSKEMGEPYKDKLFKLSPVLRGNTGCLGQYHEALKILGYFLEKFILIPHGTSLPPAREHLMAAVARRAL